MDDVAMKMPDLGTVDATVTIVRWLAEIGQHVRRGQPVVEVETDKSIMEVESTVTGTLKAIAVPAGGEATGGQVVATFGVENGTPTVKQVTVPVPSPAVADRIPTPKPAPVAAPVTPAAPGGRQQSWLERNRERKAESRTNAVPTSYPREFLLGLFERMVLIREFEEGVKFLFLEGSMPGTIHQCQGQEATAVGVCSALGPGDFITSTFRGHGHALAQGLTVEELLFELYGATTGCCKGKGGSMHVGNMERGMVPGIAIVGGGIPLAAGMGLAFKMRKNQNVVACFFGDGAVAEGAFHEGINLAAIWDAPVIFVCENNLYGASTRIDQVMRNPNIADRAAAYGIRGEQIDGNDVIAVHEATKRAAVDCRAGRGPVLLELLTYRRTGHSRRDACHYQPRDERDAWFARDPIERLAETLVKEHAVEQSALDKVREHTMARFQAAVAAARQQPLPTSADLDTDVLA